MGMHACMHANDCLGMFVGSIPLSKLLNVPKTAAVFHFSIYVPLPGSLEEEISAAGLSCHLVKQLPR